LGKNAYTTVIANPLFASFTTTESKSRVNFMAHPDLAYFFTS
jgi:hypothetical protein